MLSETCGVSYTPPFPAEHGYHMQYAPVFTHVTSTVYIVHSKCYCFHLTSQMFSS